MFLIKPTIKHATPKLISLPKQTLSTQIQVQIHTPPKLPQQVQQLPQQGQPD